MTKDLSCFSSLRLAVYYHMPYYIDHTGKLYSNSVMGTFVVSLAAHFQSVVILAPEIPKKTERTNYELANAENIEFISLGPEGRMWDHFQRMHHLRSIIQRNKGRWDILLLRVPTPRAYAIWKYCGKPTHTALLIVGNPFTSAYSAHIGWKGLFFWLRSQWFDRGLRKICSDPNHLILANTKSLASHWQKYCWSPIGLVHTSSLSERDIATKSRTDLFQRNPYRLLFVGRVCFDKGIRELLKALYELNRYQSNEYLLDIVGPLGDLGGIALNQLIESYDVTDWVNYHGSVPFGEDLLRFYREADAYILPSYHEGMPKTVWEAMSQGTPVIVSRIDGLRDFFEQAKDVIFVQPRNHASIVEAVIKLKDSPALVERICRKTILRVRDVTREVQANKIVSSMMERWGNDFE